MSQGNNNDEHGLMRNTDSDAAGSADETQHHPRHQPSSHSDEPEPSRQPLRHRSNNSTNSNSTNSNSTSSNNNTTKMSASTNRLQQVASWVQHQQQQLQAAAAAANTTAAAAESSPSNATTTIGGAVAQSLLRLHFRRGAVPSIPMAKEGVGGNETMNPKNNTQNTTTPTSSDSISSPGAAASDAPLVSELVVNNAQEHYSSITLPTTDNTAKSSSVPPKANPPQAAPATVDKQLLDSCRPGDGKSTFTYASSLDSPPRKSRASLALLHGAGGGARKPTISTQKQPRPHGLTPNKLFTSLPQRTTQIALRDNHRRDNFSIITSSTANQSSSESLGMSLSLWVDAVQTLLLSPALQNVVFCSKNVTVQMGSLVLYTVALPVTLPLQVCTHAMQLVRHTMRRLLLQNTTIRAIPTIRQQSAAEVETDEMENDPYRTPASSSVGDVIFGILSIPQQILGLAGHIAISAVSPVLWLGDSSSKPVPEKSSSTVYLDRLRLDFGTQKGDGTACDFVKPQPLDHCKTKDVEWKPEIAMSSFLLRVNDVDVRRPNDGSVIRYIDLSPVAPLYDDDDPISVVELALDQLAAGALELLSNHVLCGNIAGGTAVRPSSVIDWHAEGATQRLLRQRQQQQKTSSNNSNDASWLCEFNTEMLLWSGRFRDNKGGHGRHHGFFLARGGIHMSPLAFAKLLWDNSRTSEYNHYCLGRVTLHSVGDDDADLVILNETGDTATKVIRSEMRVPIAGLTVSAICLMHMRPLADGSGYVMVSRTLDSGPAGTHYAPGSLAYEANAADAPPPPVSSRHEILWGCNIIRTVPGHANLTELTSLSQVGSAVPSFVAHKIALMGLTDFFKNVRSVAATTTATTAADISAEK